MIQSWPQRHNMKKACLAATLLLTILALILPSQVFADTSCQPIYGGGETCTTSENIQLNKTVLNPQTNKFVDSLNINDANYQPGNTITFKITVANTGKSKISKINVTDIFPQYVNFISGSGNFDDNTKTLNFEVQDLEAGKSKDFTVVGRVFGASQLPTDQKNTICVVNQAIATNSDDESQKNQDNVKICIEKTASTSGFPAFSTTDEASEITTTPATGPEMFGLISLIPTGFAGWFLRKKSMKKGRI